MQLFGLGKKNSDKAAGVTALKASKPKIGLKEQLGKSLQLAMKFQAPVVAIVIVGLLAFTALRMLHYVDPPADYSRVQENLNKFKRVRIDPKTVQRIKQLSNSQSTPTPSLQTGRTNPFSE